MGQCLPFRFAPGEGGAGGSHLLAKPLVSLAQMPQPRLGLRLPGLPPQHADTRVQRAEQLPRPVQIGFHLPQPYLGIAATDVEPGDPGLFLEHLPPLRGTGSDDLRDPPLDDERGEVRPGGRDSENQADILRPDFPSVDAVGAARTPLDPAHHL